MTIPIDLKIVPTSEWLSLPIHRCARVDRRCEWPSPKDAPCNEWASYATGNPELELCESHYLRFYNMESKR